MSYERSTIRIPSVDKRYELDAWRFLPSNKTGPFTTVILAHGFGLAKSNRLEPFAQAFAAAGYAALAFDYRGYGASDGQPRNDLDPVKQVQDYRSVSAYCRSQPETYDKAKLGLFGTSWSGGLVIQVAAQESEIAFVISQVPHLDGRALDTSIDLKTLKIVAYAVASAAKKMLGLSPVYIPTFGRGNDWALMSSDGPNFELFGGDMNDRDANRIDATVAFRFRSHRPILSAPRVCCPVLFVCAEQDQVVSVEAIHKAAKLVRKGQLYTLECDHFGPYHGRTTFQQAS